MTSQKFLKHNQTEEKKLSNAYPNNYKFLSTIDVLTDS